MGALLGLLTSFSITSTEIFSRRITNEIGPIVATSIVSLVAAVTTVVVALVTDGTIIARDMVLGGLSGICFGIGMATYFEGLRVSSSAVMGPTVASLSALIPFGWAAVTGSLSVEPLLLFAIIFMWTPPHFWALALFRNEDYTRAGVPMMPVVAGEFETRRQILIYAFLLAPLAVAPSLIGMAGMGYGILSAALGINFVRLSWVLYRRPDDAAAKRLFAFSILYLFLLFLGLVVDKLVAISGLVAGL